MVLLQRSALSSVTRLWSCYNGARCRVQLDGGPLQRSALSSVIRRWTVTTERAVECNSTMDLLQRTALSSVTRRRTYMSYRVNSLGQRRFSFPESVSALLTKLLHEIRCQIFFHIQPETNHLTEALSVLAVPTFLHVFYKILRAAHSYLRSLLIWKETAVG